MIVDIEEARSRVKSLQGKIKRLKAKNEKAKNRMDEIEKDKSFSTDLLLQLEYGELKMSIPLNNLTISSYEGSVKTIEADIEETKEYIKSVELGK